MKTVYAYRDNGWMSMLTRWKPRRVFCTEEADHGDEPGIEHVVKYRQGQDGTAALISEVVCGQLLAAGGLPVVECRFVMVSENFAGSYATKSEIPYTVEEGLHFASVLLHDVENGPPERFEDLAEPQTVVDLWAFDSWFCTIDRATYGNILLRPNGAGKYEVIAADQSDCFGGAGRFADGSWRKVLAESPPAESVAFLDRTIFEAGDVEALERSLSKIDGAADHLDEIKQVVPSEWWELAGIDGNHVKDALLTRRRKMRDILNVEKWESLDDDIKDGYLL